MSLIIHHRMPVGLSHSTVLPDMDFETYSEAGYKYDPKKRIWVPLLPNKRNGLEIVGTPAYSEHPTTEVLSMGYNLKMGAGRRLWAPHLADPTDLFAHIAAGEPLEAWNSLFEFFIWMNVCVARMGWPQLPLDQLRDAMAKARAHSLPGALEEAAKAINSPVLKIEDGKRLLNKFSKPRRPTKKDARLRILPEPDDPDTLKLYEYNLGDIEAEAAVSALVPDLSNEELQVWLMDQRMNVRGVAVDVESVGNLQVIVNQALERGTQELVTLTEGAIEKPTQNIRIVKWLKERGIYTDSLDADHVDALLERDDLTPQVRRVIEIRAALGSASVKKLNALARCVSSDGRVRDLFSYCGAERTGRWAGRGPQPQNLPKKGPKVRRCQCGHHFGRHRADCPWCGLPSMFTPVVKWSLAVAEDVLLVAGMRSLLGFEYFFDETLSVVSGCLRALFCAGPDRELISSDYSAIEAVVLAALAGEEWRLEVFRTHGMIYEMSASKITGVPFSDFVKHKEATGEHHPLRSTIGKVAELSGGFQGWIGAWKNFGADEYFDNDDDLKEAVVAWRRESPAIVNLWKGLEDAAKAAIRQPGVRYTYRWLSYIVVDDVLYCRLPSGRQLTYHQPRLNWGETPYGKTVEKISFMGWDNIATKWLRIETYGGKLTENATQATARDIFAHGMLNLDRAGYPLVIHTHDEPACEVPMGFGSIEEFEALICDLPAWCWGWPIRASDGWRGQRHRKD